MPVVPALETRRLLLRPLRLDDARQVQELFPSWEIVRYLASIVPWPYPADGAFVYYRDCALPAMERGDEWHWSLRLKTAPDQLIGCISLMRGENNRGFWLGLPWHGKGLMTEAVEAVTGYWFEDLKFPILRAPKAIANVASRRISEKSGMRLLAVEERDYVSGRLPTEIWEITADEWRAHRRGKLENMSLDLQYPIGKFQFIEHPAEAQREEWIAQIAEAPAKLRQSVAGLTEQQLETPYRPGGWTVRQVVHHMPDSHMNAYVRIRLALTEDEPLIKTYNEKAWAQLSDAQTGPVEPSLRLLESLHERLVALFRSLSPSDWDRTLRHPELGVVPLGRYLGLYAWHGRHHVAHVLSVRGRAAAV